MKRVTIAMSLAALGLATAAEAAPRYRVTIESEPSGAAVFLEAKEGGVQGHTPHVFKLESGTYTIIVEKEGYHPQRRDIEVKRRAQTFSFTLVKRAAPARLNLSAAEEVSAGAEVRINGKLVGQVPITVTLQRGRYLIEVSKPGFETLRQWADVAAGEQRDLPVALKATGPSTGSVIVGSNVVGAAVLVDGKQVDTTPALVEGLSPGEHQVEVRAPGHGSQRQTVAVTLGKTVKVAMVLQPETPTSQQSGATLQVLASNKDVEVIVDGQSRGRAPVQVEGLAAGSHLVQGRREGMTGVEQTVELKTGEVKTIKLEFASDTVQQRVGSIRVVSPVLGAKVFVDGRFVGKTPLLRHDFDPGPHFVSVQHEGYKERVTTVEVKVGEVAQVEAPLEKEVEKTDPAQMVETKLPPDEPERLRATASYHAVGVPPGFFSGDLSLGFPHLFEGRLTAGLFSGTHLGLDGGIEFRTYGVISEIGLQTKLRLFNYDPLSFALLYAMGGGGGPKSRNTFYINFGAVGSMSFARRVFFSTRAFFNFYTDRLCPGAQESGELGACSSPPGDISRDEVRGRFARLRFFLSAVLEVSVGRNINIFGIFEGVPFQPSRESLTDPFAALMPASDPGTYFRLGISIKR